MDKNASYIGFLLFCWLSPTLIWAQIVSSDDLLEQARQYFQGREYDSAVWVAKQVLDQSTEPELRAWAYYEAGRAQRRRELLTEATDNLTNTIRITQDNDLKGKAHYELGKSYSDQVNAESAIYHYERALLFDPDTLDLVKVYEGIADEYNYYFANYQEAESFYEKSLRRLQSLSAKYPSLRLRLLYNLATVHYQRGDFYAALDYVQQATQIARETNSSNLERCYSLSGAIYHQLSRYPAAITAYKSAIEQGVESGGDMNSDLPRYYNNLGLLYHDQEQYPEAIPYFRQAEHIASYENYPRAVADQADSYQYLGNAYSELHSFDTAHQYLKQALRLKRSFYGNDHPETARILEGFRRYYQQQGKQDSALYYQQQALIAETPNFSEESVGVNPDWQQLQDYSRTYATLNTKAELLYQRYQREKNLNDLTLAISTFARADSLMHLHRVSYEYETSQLQLLQNQKSSYEMAVASCYLLYEATQNEEYARLGLYFMERSKAVILWDVLRDVAARSSLGISDTLQREEREIKAQLTRLVNEMTEERRQPTPDRTKLDSLQEKRFGLHRRQTYLQERLFAAYPNYVQLKYASPALPWNQIQERLAERQDMLEFFWGKEHTYALSISQQGMKFYRVTVSELLTNAIEQLQRLLQRGPSSGDYDEEAEKYLTLAYRVYEAFLAPAFSLKSLPDHLTIVPDGPLSYLPFEALLTEKVALSDDPDYRTLPYLLRTSTVQYSPSLQVMFSAQRPSSDSNAYLRLLAFGFTQQFSRSISIGQRRLVALPGTFKELKAIERLTSAQLLAGAEASETHFKRHAEDYQVLHLALHGLADSANSNNNVIFFPASSDSINDGKLHSFELYDLQLGNTKLAVLSACETGTGRWEAGEGVYSMGRGFAYAGCPSVIMSLWKVNDAFTARIMPTFYRSLFKGERIDQSLRKAKLRFISRANQYQAHPSYWAAFVLQGEFSPIIDYRDTYLATVIIILVSAGYLLTGVLRKRKPVKILAYD